MYKGKYAQTKKRRLTPWAALAFALVLAISVGGTVAYLATNTDALANIFTPANSGNKIEEEFKNNVKRNVFVSNTSEYDAFIRAMIVVSWKDADGTVLAELPVEGVDYKIDWGTTWREKDGFYYWPEKVLKGGKTENLINECIQLKEKTDYFLHVEIFTQSIQADPTDAVIDAWGFVPGSSN